jgi:hypothetical protein
MIPPVDPADPDFSDSHRAMSIEREIEAAERKLALIRRKQKDLAEWDRSRRPIRIGFFVVIPIVLLIEAVHLYSTFDKTQGNRRAPWLMLASTLVVAAISWWYYRQARSQRDRVFRGWDRAARYADELEIRIVRLRAEAGVTGPESVSRDRCV